MKTMFIVYHDINVEARSQEILETAKKISSETILVTYAKPLNQNTKVIVTGNGERNYFSFIKDSINAIKEENPKVIILHDNYTAYILKWIKKYRKEIFVIYDSSELYIDQKKTNIKTLLASYMNYLEKKYLKYADLVIAANEERAEIMKEYFNLIDEPLVFDNIHRIDDIYDIEESERKFGNYFKEDSINIVYGGGIAKQRLTFELAQAILELGDQYNLIIVGRCLTKDKKEFDRLFKGKENINFLGFVSRKELRYLFNKAQISVSIFSQDTVNNINCASGKLYESLFEGTPILTSENPPLKRLCLNYQVGVSNDNFKSGILELEKNYEFYRENVKIYTAQIDFENRIPTLAKEITEIMKYRNVMR